MSGEQWAAAERALVGEFGCWYLNDELPLGWSAEIDAYARSSAAALLAVVGRSGVPVMGALLRRLREDRAHPLHQRLQEVTLMPWTEQPALWADYTRLLAAIEAALGNPQEP